MPDTSGVWRASDDQPKLARPAVVFSRRPTELWDTSSTFDWPPNCDIY